MPKNCIFYDKKADKPCFKLELTEDAKEKLPAPMPKKATRIWLDDIAKLICQDCPLVNEDGKLKTIIDYTTIQYAVFRPQ